MRRSSMDPGFVKRIGDVIIERVGPPGSSMTPPPPPTIDGVQVSQPLVDGPVPELLPGMYGNTVPPRDDAIEGDGSTRVASSDQLRIDKGENNLHIQDDPPEASHEPTQSHASPGDLDEDDIVPDFPDEDLNEDHVPLPLSHDDEVGDPGDLHEPPIEDDLDEGDGDESDADVLAGLKDAAGDVALMESEDLLREIKPEPMEQDGGDEEEQNEEGEEGGEDREEDCQKDDENGKRERESDNEEDKANKKKKSEEEDSDKKKSAINFRKNIREVMDETQLDEATLAAQRQEAERLRRVQDQQKYLREMQIQRQMQIQKNRANRMMSFLQGGSGSTSLIKASSSSQGVQSPSSKPNTVVVKLGSGGPPQLLNKKVLEAIRGGKSSPSPPDTRPGLTRIINKPHMVTPSVSIAPVKPAEKKAFVNPDVVTISSSDDEEDDKPSNTAAGADAKVKEEPEDEDDDCIVISEPSDEEEEEEVDTNNSGMHTNDLFNCPDEQGRVLINVGKQEGESEIFLAPQIARVIKPHQIGGIRFLFDNIIESVERFKTSTGFGCILAHSMGLGKTLQVVSFCDVFLRETPGRTIMCIMPINTLQNWMAEFNMWLPMDPSASPLAAQGEVRPRDFQIYVLNDLHKTIASRARVVAEWQKQGGVLLIGYEMYRQLSLRKGGRGRKGKKKNPDEDMDDVKNKPHLENMHEALVKPGPDLVICDEGHRIKNSHASISHALKQIRTKRRVVLTGYPLQNNLLEYWCMVDFVRPNYLGTKTEFSNMFERPIQNGQCIDSTPQDIRLMRYRAHVLHSLLEGFVQRRSHSVLRNSLPQKEEYVLLVRMTPFQRTLYDTFMNEVVRTKAVPNPLKAFAVCCKIWNHPDILYNFLKKKELDELQDLDLEETANLNPNQTVDPNSPRRGGETRGKKGKGGKKAPAVPIKPAATVPPTNAQPDVKSDPNPNFEFNRDPANFPPGEGYNPPGEFNNFDPNIRPGNYYQNNYNYQNFAGQPDSSYNNYQGGEFNNYNNYYQNSGSGNYPNNYYPTVKKEEEFQDKKEEIKFSQQKALSGGQVVYNSQFGPGQFEPKKEFTQYNNEWAQQQNYSNYQPWAQEPPDQKPKTEDLMPGYPQQQGFQQQTPNFQPAQNPNFSTQNFGEQSGAGMPAAQNPNNFGPNSGFPGQQNQPISAPSQDFQQSGYSQPVQNKPNYNPGFEGSQNAGDANPSGFPQNFPNQSGSSHQAYPQNFNQPNQSHANPTSQNFGNQTTSSSQPNQQGFSSNYGNQTPCGTSFPNQPSQGFQNFPPNPNPNDGFQQNFGNQPGPSSQPFGHSVTSTSGHNSKNQSCPPDYRPPNQPNIPTSQPSGYPNNQTTSSYGNFPGPPGSSAPQQYQASDAQSTYSNAGASQAFQNRPSGHNPQPQNTDFYPNFPAKSESGAQTNNFPQHFQGGKPDMQPHGYPESTPQGYFGGPPQNLFRPHQDGSQQQKHESASHQSQQNPQMFDSFSNTANMPNVQNPPNQNYGVSPSSPAKNIGFGANHPDMGGYSMGGPQSVDGFPKSLGSDTFRMDNKFPEAGFAKNSGPTTNHNFAMGSKMDQSDMSYQHMPSKDGYVAMGKNPQGQMDPFAPMSKDQPNVSYGPGKSQDMMGPYGSNTSKKSMPMGSSGYMGSKNSPESSLGGFSGAGKVGQNSQGYGSMGSKDAGNFGQINKTPMEIGANYGGPNTKNVSGSSRDQSKPFMPQEQHSMGFNAPMHEPNPYGTGKNPSDTAMGGNYRQSDCGSSGGYNQSQNQGQPMQNYMGSVPQGVNYDSYGVKEGQQEYGQMSHAQSVQASGNVGMTPDSKQGSGYSGKSSYGAGSQNQGFPFNRDNPGSYGQMGMGCGSGNANQGPMGYGNPVQGQNQSSTQMGQNQGQMGQNQGQMHGSQPLPGNVPPTSQNQVSNPSGNYIQNQSGQDQQNPFYQNQNYHFDQPGTSFDMKEKRGMSCQTEFEKDPDKEDEEGKKDDEKRDDSKKVGEVQVSLPTTKSGKEDVGIPYDWATELLKGYVPGDIHASAKMSIFFCILEESIALGDRILVFSQSLFTLNLMEELLQRHNIPGKEEKWARNLNYYRLDGSTTAIEREKLINEFNSNPKLHLFLVSTRAGSLGINLVGANRVIVFDASWNPCHDTQAVCRVYRYGQKKPCFVYRIVTDNCLEKKIYDRQINKQGMSDRVVDECNPDAHLSIKEVTSLCWDDKADDTEVKDYTDIQDQYIDVVIQKVLQQHSKLLSKEPFQHESLLVDRKEKKLSQAEKRLAKRSYELEKQASGTNRPLYQNNIVSNQGGIIRRGSDKPMASVRPMQSEMGSQLVRGENRQRGWIPASVWQRQGMSAQEMTLPLDVVIPTNAPDRSSIVLKAGQKVMVLKSPKGIYMQLENGKIIAIRTAFKPGNQGGNKDVGAGPKKSTGTGPDPSRRNVSVIPSNLRNNSAVSITPRGPVSSGSGTGPGRAFSQGNRPVRAVGPTHRPSPVSVTVTKKRPPPYDHAQHVVANPSPAGSRMSSKSDESEGCDNSVSPARPPPSPHHDSRDSMASSSSQYGSYSNSSRSTPVLPSFARDVSITPYSSKDHRGSAAPSNSGSSIPSGYRDPGGGYPTPARTEVSITPFSQDNSREESRKDYDGGGGGPGPGGPPPPPPHEYRQENRPFASVSLDSSNPYRHDPLGHGESGGSRGVEGPMESSPGDLNKRAFQPYPTPYPPPPPAMDKGSSSGPGLYNPYHMENKAYEDKGHGTMRPHPLAEASKHQPHPLYHHRPQGLHEPDNRPFRSDKPMYHPPRPDGDKQFQPPEQEKPFMPSQKSFMQSLLNPERN